MSGGHLGLLAIEVDLVDSPPSFLMAFEQCLTTVLENSPELLAAQVNALPPAGRRRLRPARGGRGCLRI